MTASQYFPPVLLQWSPAPFADQQMPLAESLDGAVLLVDISGFTDLTERLASKGKPGAEQINNVLTCFFTDIGKVIDRHCGTILGYEGDSVIVGWRETAALRPDDPLLACCACAAEIRRDFSPRNVDGHALDVRISIGTGRIDLIHMGLDRGRRHLLPAGPAIDEAALLSKEARRGEALVSPQNAARIQAHFECLPCHENGVTLIKPTNPLATFGERRATDLVKAAPDPTSLEGYLLPLMRTRLNSALAEWMGELRKLTLIFIEVVLKDGADDLDTINATAIEIEGILQSLGGVVISIKLRHGLLLIETAFGLPGEASKNDDWRAIATVMELQAKSRSGRFGLCAGIATGRVFCGPFGAPAYRIYTVIGSAANRAARLRDVATARILVDEETQKISQRSIGFEGPWPLQLSGIRGNVQAYVPTEDKRRQPQGTRHHIVGRRQERELLRQMLRDCADQVQVALIHGEGGIGKSTLVASLLSEFNEADRGFATGMGDALDRQTPYRAWRAILRQFLGLSAQRPLTAADLPGFLSGLEGAIGDTNLAPLINDVIDLNLPETRVTASMPSNVRAENLRKLLLKLIVHHLSHTTRVLVIEDAHWLDNASRILLVEIIRAAPPALVLITSRVAGTMASDLAELATEGHNVQQIALGRMNKATVMEVARHTLGEGQISDALQNFIVQTSDGVPLFVEELCHLATTLGQSGEMELTELPNLLEATILGRIDTLSPEDQLVLKTASVFGLRFKRHLLSRLNPLVEPGIDVQAAVARITDLRLFRFDRDQPDNLGFRHQIIRDLVYDGLLSNQKAEAHAAVAYEMEAQSTADDIETLPLLLTHWRRAGRVVKVVSYLEKLAALRLRQFDNATAISLLEEYFERLYDDDVPKDTMRDARCFMMLGKAHSGLGKMVEAESAFRNGLAILGMRLPDSRRSLARELGRQLFTQLRQRRRADHIQMPAADAPQPLTRHQQRAEMAAEAHEALMQIFYFNGQKGRLLHSAMSAANLSGELGRATPSLAVNTAGLGAICGVIPLRKQAAVYLQRASQIARIVDNPASSSRVCLYSGLYETAVANCERAKQHFTEGMESANLIRDQRLWCEHAVSYELIFSPWSLTRAFADYESWDSLVDQLEEISLERDDMQVHACALLGRLRANHAIGRAGKNQKTRAALETLLQPGAPKLEFIHYVEGAALLATAAFATGDTANGQIWLSTAQQKLAELDSGMKSRTLPALTAMFDACLRQLDHSTPDQAAPTLKLATLVVGKLRTFSRIYPIGRPHYLLCKGDLAMLNGKPRVATRHWRSGLTESMRLHLHAAEAILKRRLSSADSAAQDPCAVAPTLAPGSDTDPSAIHDMFKRVYFSATDIPVGLSSDKDSGSIPIRNH